MRPWIHAILFLVMMCLAWEQEDHQIFDLQDALKRLIDPKADFYTVLNIGRDADERTITKAYRKTSLKW